MKISGSTISMESTHRLLTRQETSESLRRWGSIKRPDFEAATNTPRAASRPGKTQEAAAATEARNASDNDPFILLMRTMIEWFTGEPVKIFDARQIDDGGTITRPADVQTKGFGVEYNYHALREEFERTEFSARGIVRTADGMEVAFRLDVVMTRMFHEETTVGAHAGYARRKDPLVLNFDGTRAQLSSQRFRFDIDNDGLAEEVPRLGSGSGYLALDINGNGRIDSGAELFGPISGSGFHDLSLHDDDANGWIDETDAVFDRLRVWAPDASGEGTLDTLTACGVGALCLDRAKTPFELRGERNNNLGAIRESGLYLTESGIAQALQEIDLTV